MDELNQNIAENLLYPLWDCLSVEYKERYKKNIWEQFENGIRSAAYTAKLSIFLENIKKKLPIQLKSKYHQDIFETFNTTESQKILRRLREETTLLVMLVRINNEEVKEARRTIIEQKNILKTFKKSV